MVAESPALHFQERADMSMITTHWDNAGPEPNLDHLAPRDSLPDTRRPAELYSFGAHVELGVSPVMHHAGHAPRSEDPETRRDPEDPSALIERYDADGRKETEHYRGHNASKKG